MDSAFLIIDNEDDIKTISGILVTNGYGVALAKENIKGEDKIGILVTNIYNNNK